VNIRKKKPSKTQNPKQIETTTKEITIKRSKMVGHSKILNLMLQRLDFHFHLQTKQDHSSFGR